MNPLFVSYRKSDSQQYTLALAEALACKLGNDAVFVDKEGIEVGKRFDKVLQEQLRQAGAMLVVMGPGWLTAKRGMKYRLRMKEDWVRREVATALRRGIYVLPLLLPGATWAKAEELPRELEALAKVQFLKVEEAEDVAGKVAKLVRENGLKLQIKSKGRYIGKDPSELTEDWWKYEIWLEGPKGQLDEIASGWYHFPEWPGDDRWQTLGARADYFRFKDKTQFDLQIEAHLIMRDGREVRLYHTAFFEK